LPGQRQTGLLSKKMHVSLRHKEHHLGNSTKDFCCDAGSHEQATTEEEKGPHMLVSHKMTMSHQCHAIVQKAHVVHGLSSSDLRRDGGAWGISTSARKSNWSRHRKKASRSIDY